MLTCYNQWMKKILLFVVLIILVLAALFISRHDERIASQLHPEAPTPTIVPVQITNTMLFVPYWTMQDGIKDTYNEYVYFGVVPDETGAVVRETGYQTIPTFLRAVPKDGKKFLGVRMIDNTVNEAVLEDADKQQKIIADAF